MQATQIDGNSRATVARAWVGVMLWLLMRNAMRAPHVKPSASLASTTAQLGRLFDGDGDGDGDEPPEVESVQATHTPGYASASS